MNTFNVKWGNLSAICSSWYTEIPAAIATLRKNNYIKSMTFHKGQI